MPNKEPSGIIKELTKDIFRPDKSKRTIIQPPDETLDKRVKSWGGVPEKVDNWQAIALTAIETLMKWKS